MLEQRIGGLVLIAMGLLSCCCFERDITAALVIVPLGCWLLFSRQELFYKPKKERRNRR